MSNYGQRHMTQRASAPRRIAQVAPQAFRNNPELVAEIFGMVNPLIGITQSAPQSPEPSQYSVEARGQTNKRKHNYLVLAMRGENAGAREHWWVWKDSAADLAFKTWQTSNPGGVLPATEFEAFAKMMAVQS